MGGYLTVPQSQSDHDYINLFLDTHIGEPQEIVAFGEVHDYESWNGVLRKPTIQNGAVILSWEAQQCQFFHLCEAYNVSFSQTTQQ